jgi:predicted transcriptional regulator
MAKAEKEIVTVAPHRLLGPLDWRVLEIVWELKQCSVRDIVKRLPEERAYTTVMTTLARLHKKDILSCSKVNRTFLYSPRMSCQELRDSVTQNLIVGLLEVETTSQELLISSLLDELRSRDSKLFKKIMRRTTENHQR